MGSFVGVPGQVRLWQTATAPSKEVSGHNGRFTIRRPDLPHTTRDRRHIASTRMERLPNSAHTSQAWRIHDIAPDFRLEDVWQLPGRGGPGDFPRVVELMASFDTAKSGSRAVRLLFAIRWKLGELFGWDDETTGADGRAPTLRDRLPEELRHTDTPDFDALPFTPLYMTKDEFAAEIANKTMHGVMHIGAVPDGAGAFRAQMAVLVKPNGLFGNLYMAAIRPFRHLIVYPALMREADAIWSVSEAGRRSRAGTASSSAAAPRARPAD